MVGHVGDGRRAEHGAWLHRRERAPAGRAGARVSRGAGRAGGGAHVRLPHLEGRSLSRLASVAIAELARYRGFLPGCEAQVLLQTFAEEGRHRSSLHAAYGQPLEAQLHRRQMKGGGRRKAAGLRVAFCHPDLGLGGALRLVARAQRKRSALTESDLDAFPLPPQGQNG